MFVFIEPNNLCCSFLPISRLSWTSLQYVHSRYIFSTRFCNICMADFSGQPSSQTNVLNDEIAMD
mgnify:CR=1 FL=1